MTDEQKYSELLKEVGAMLKSKNDYIAYQKYQIGDLKDKLAVAEAELKNLKGNDESEL